MSRDRLGRGLGALLGDYLEPQPTTGEIRHLKVSAIAPNPVQPRRVFDQAELVELAASIRENGLLQPLVVRTAPAGEDRFELIAGERRLRAVTSLGWEEVPAVVREASDETLLVLALVENLQREELNALEEAEGYKVLTERFGMSQADVARVVGKDRSTVANILRLLKLPPSVRKLLAEGALSMGHARALLAVADPQRASRLASQAAREGWSVREVEKKAGAETPAKKRPRKPVDPAVRALEDALRAHLETRVHIRHQARGNGKGVIEVTFHGPEDFERVFERIVGRSASQVVG